MEIIEKIASKVSVVLVMFCAADLVGLKIPGLENVPLYQMTGGALLVWMFASLMGGKGLDKAMAKVDEMEMKKAIKRADDGGRRSAE